VSDCLATKFRLNEVVLEIDEDEELLPTKVANYLNLLPDQLLDWLIVRSAIDARRKGRILRVYSVEFTVANPEPLLSQLEQDRRLVKVKTDKTQPTVVVTKYPRNLVVIGMGPAGLFAALWLARAGHNVTLIDRGQPVEQRIKDVENFWDGGLLQPDSNVQFGEGGAGTFSDGKLTARKKHPLTSFVLKTLVEFGAPEEILYQAKPHIGTDRLRCLLLNFRIELQNIGVKICFNSCLTDIQANSSKLCALVINDCDEIQCDAAVLAIGHSARDTYALLERKGITLQAKPFAVGVRVEHPIELIDAIQYGATGVNRGHGRGKADRSEVKRHPNLPPADYALAYNDPDSGRGIYSFCMCPGGQVVQSSSEAEMVVVNGMSDYRRASAYSNSALVVSVRPQDFEDDSPLAGVRFQQYWEGKAFSAGGGNYRVPIENMLDFMEIKGGGRQLNSSCRAGTVSAPLDQFLPNFVAHGLRQALPHFDRKMRGFVTAEATLTAIESRTSAPVRIVRDQSGQALGCPGIYPAGEGAGYAGGIMSAAIDGINAAINMCGS